MTTQIPDDALKAAAGLAAASKHPYAQAIVAAARSRKIAVAAPEGVEETPGRGLARALLQGEERLGSAEWCHIESRRRGERGLVCTGLAGAGSLSLCRCAPSRRR